MLEQLLTSDNLQKAGLTLIGLFLAWIIWKLVTNHDNHLLTALDRNTDAWIKNAEALTKLTDKLEIEVKKPKK